MIKILCALLAFMLAVYIYAKTDGAGTQTPPQDNVKVSTQLPATSTGQSKKSEVTAIPIILNATADPKEIPLGGKTTVTVFAVHPKGIEIRSVGIPESPDFEVKPLGTDTKPAPEEPDKLLTTFRYEVSVFTFDENGSAELPPAVIVASGEGFPPEQLSTSRPTVKLKLQFTTEKGATADIDDVANTKELIRPDYRILFAIIGALLAALAIAAFKLYRMFKSEKEKSIAPPPIPLPADEIALRKLNEIVAKEYLKHGEIDLYYEEVSEVIREFVGNLYKFDSIEMTSEELLQTLSSFPTPGLDIARFRKFLDHTDHVKFSEMIPTLEECSGILNDAYYFVKTARSNEDIGFTGVPPKTADTPKQSNNPHPPQGAKEGNGIS